MAGVLDVKRSGPIKAKKRTKQSFARIYGSPERVAWVKSLPCSVVGCTEGPIHNAHTETGGMGRKADYTTIIPLCWRHHQFVHERGMAELQRHFPLAGSPADVAASIAAAWERIVEPLGGDW